MTDKRNGGGVLLSSELRKRLAALPAVRAVTEKRIEYSPEFRDEVVRRYAEGDSPVRIFRDHGLEPREIGYKRVERCVARWCRPRRDDRAEAA